MRGARRWVLSGAAVALLAVVLLVVGALGGSPSKPTQQRDQPSARAATDPLSASIALAQKQLKVTPKNARTWASLAISYIAQAKATVDPSYYAKAAGAAQESLTLNSTSNDAGYAALAALKSAEHKFTEALAAADKGLAINAFSSILFGAKGDALTQLGRYPEAAAAIDRMNQLLPGVPAFTRASYVFELRGDVPSARSALKRALQDASSPGDTAFARNYLGELAFNYGGDAAGALTEFEAGLSADPRDFPLKAGRAKVLAALGRTTEALAAYSKLVSSVPQPQYVLEYAELLEAQHDPQAQRQYALFRTEEDLFRANNVVLDTEPTLFEADHGSPTKALEYARAGWKTRPFLEMADAYGWAEYANKNYRAALGWSDRALATGWTNALFHFHRGMIEKALGHRAEAVAELTKALTLNPHFNPLQVPQARAALQALKR